MFMVGRDREATQPPKRFELYRANLFSRGICVSHHIGLMFEQIFLPSPPVTVAIAVTDIAVTARQKCQKLC